MLIADMESAREIVQLYLEKKGMTQAELARQLEILPASLSRTLKAPPIRQDSHWPRILEALGLEIVIRPKGEK